MGRAPAAHLCGIATMESNRWGRTVWMRTGPSPAQTTVPEERGQRSWDAHRQPSVLVVDDEREIVELLSTLLEEEGYRVVPAFDGVEAWELASAQHPDLVISDVMMPRMSGLELVSRLRGAADSLADTPIILMSAVPRAAETDGVAFLSKPFDLDRVLSLVSTELAAD